MLYLRVRLTKLRHLVGRTSAQPVQNGQLSLTRVAGQDLCKHVRHFLGYHMIKEFEVLDFLEESGTQHPMDTLQLHKPEKMLRSSKK